MAGASCTYNISIEINNYKLDLIHTQNGDVHTHYDALGQWSNLMQEKI